MHTCNTAQPTSSIQCTTISPQPSEQVSEPLRPPSPVNLFLSVADVALTFNHDHAYESADDGEEDENEYDGDANCPFSRGEQVMQRMISVNEWLQVRILNEGRGWVVPLLGSIVRSRQTAPS